jgi:hypothetical protein
VCLSVRQKVRIVLNFVLLQALIFEAQSKLWKDGHFERLSDNILPFLHFLHLIFLRGQATLWAPYLQSLSEKSL